MEQLYDATKKLVGKYSKSERPVTDNECKTITETHEQRNSWVEHFGELLNRPAQLNSLDIEAGPTDLPTDVNLGKVFNRMLLDRMKDSLDAQL
ncbi:unnamed protein product [Schistosoma curassoni]|uniref:DHC_N2 domain-containing protein n=1 Tax=Schistosoma curassoni TaxID=6186 RepID=A0A183KC34_9TREM|nr:unnamed protein product [Schistosoma curassoni]